MLWLPAILVFSWSRSGAEALLLRSLSLALVAYILLQGGIYWHRKARALERGEHRLSPATARLFVFFRRSTRIALGAHAALLAGVLLRGGFDPWDFALGVALLGFAVLEYVNYYHYQLMHDNANDLRYLFRNRRVRRAALRTDLDRHRMLEPRKR